MMERVSWLVELLLRGRGAVACSRNETHSVLEHDVVAPVRVELVKVPHGPVLEAVGSVPLFRVDRVAVVAAVGG